MGEKRKEIIMPTKRRGQGKEAKKGKVKEVTKRRATTGKGQGKAIKRGKMARTTRNKATGRTREKKINKRKMIKTRARKKGRSGKDSKLLPEFLYNQLWCFDLAMEQALERC